ncbi:uncharacterized protein isoform X2 [Musca autumnalis]|uniref:uncharacterized protein isoform X2 n=1 Tax=Musca autumnalis TaxID=221902 RepID=UPI003CE8B491
MVLLIRKKSTNARKSLAMVTKAHSITSSILMTGLLIVRLIVVINMTGSLQANPITSRFNSSDIDFKRYCGRSLTDLMLLICGENVRPVSNTNVTGNNSLRSRNGETISDCCRHPCGYTQLKLYCPEE